MKDNQVREHLDHVTGLRAVAILLVLLFHLDGVAWRHGYVGVDVFLVISGYLMLRARQRQVGLTSWRDALRYLGKRVRRLVPPMAVLLLLTLGGGFLLCEWEGIEEICKVGERTCWMNANDQINKMLADYFRPDKDYMPLLHMWYMSVVMQLYALYAVGNLALQRLPRRLALGCVAALGVLSLLYCYSLPLYELLVSWGLLPQGKELFSGASYYSMWARVWEVAAGGLVLLLPEARTPARAAVAAGLGLLLIFAAALGGAEPGQMLAVAGAVLLLRYAPQCRLGALLSWRPLLWLGGISFSLYLVHMPVYVYWRMWLIGHVSAWDEVGMLVVAVLLGWGYWWAVEKRRFPWWLVGVLYVAALVSSRVGRKTTGFQKWALPTVAVTSEPFSVPVRLTRDARLLAHAEPKLNPWRACRFCLALPAKDRAMKLPLFDLGGGSGTASGEVVCVMGDSHATDLCEGIGHMLRREPGEVSFVYLASVVAPFHGWDFPLRTARSDYYFNPPKEEALFAWLESHPEVTRLMIAFRWQHQIQQQMHLTSQAAEADLRAFLQRARSLGRQVFLMAPVYEFQSAFTRMTRVLYLRGMGLDDERFVSLNTCTRAQYQAAHGETLRMLRQLESEGLCVVLDPISALPPDEGYGAVKDGVLLYRDSNHLTASGSVWLIEKIWPQLQQKLALPPTQP